MRGFRKASGTELVTAFRRAEVVNATVDDLLQRRIDSYVSATNRILLQDGGCRGGWRLRTRDRTVLRNGSLPETRNVVHHGPDHGNRDQEPNDPGKENKHLLLFRGGLALGCVRVHEGSINRAAESRNHILRGLRVDTVRL